MSLYSKTRDRSPEALDFIPKVSLFSSLKEEQLSEIAKNMQRRMFAPGVVLFHQDMPGVTLYMVEEGWIRIYSLGRTGQEHTLTIIGPGEVFGELSLLDNKLHSASAITLTPTVVWLLHRQYLDDLLKRYSEVNQAMIQILVNRMRTVINHAEAMTFQDVQGRLAYEILLLAERHGKEMGNAIEIDIPLTQTELATMVGATRESVNKALTPLRSGDLIRLDGNLITVVDPDGLRRIVYERGR